ncbi:hypothetical protein BDV26DRAFT_292502 [Aspergillus bertholletiae]|uniref:Uncharacterized protein n=1 Tax=Aspergillus bertholletiae TaxID=1226010 RepID=A0A5N7B8U1_9EURO|nr:hypothetical protein BDV26DRAFT_292502 [Aspergillus bertholletiae]
MKITVASLVTLACLTVGPAGAIPVDSIYDRATNARPHTEDDSPLKALHATPTSHRMSHTCTDTHIEPRASSVTFADGDSETDEDTEPPVVTGTPTSHHMGPSCTTIPRGPANAGPTAGIEVPNDGVDMTPPRGVATRPKSPVAPLVPEPLTRKAQSEGHLRSATDAGTVGQAHKRSDPGSKTPSISMPALQPSPTGQSEWIHGVSIHPSKQYLVACS